MQKAYEAFQNQDYQTAVDCLNKELADDAKNGYAYLWMAIAYTTVDDYGSMLTNSDKAIQYLPKKDKESRGVAFNLRSSAYSGLGQQDLALADISEAINLDPKDVDYLNSRAQIYFEQFQYELADADAKKITELEPGNPLGWLCLGRNADARKDYDKAIEHYNYAVKLDNSNAQSYSLRAPISTKNVGAKRPTMWSLPFLSTLPTGARLIVSTLLPIRHRWCFARK